MRPVLACTLAAASFAASIAVAAAADISQWFFGATALHGSNAVATRTSRPDFLGGTTQAAMHCGADGRGIGGTWLLAKYDRRHNIGLAVASTDQCSAVVFKAPPPGIVVPDADLSSYRTGRGVHLGMSYPDVLAVYGGKPVERGAHFVVAYLADVPGTTVSLPHRRVKMPQTITLVFDDGRVSSIGIEIEEGGLF